ncbi:MarR family winged helix-turn-helix transcriptional regulator [Mycolicibacterium mengxianglii]|uniref:MarR family winged helix-turn-helix transcriptional regulator n=1 Tax=Mycolicibacterium mengxianglii TaxID=2736649 RepID=UPI0018D01EBE|nr:MarR family winged helix-turn-helix transcriptional regulator [Mycolicibacterium mengxianglii]
MTELPVVSPNQQLVGPLLEQLTRRLRTESESEIARFGLRARHVIALTLLRDFGERQQSELAGMLRIDPTNVVGLLNELEDLGLIERRRRPPDRRRHKVALTQAGADRLADIEAVLIDVERRVLTALDDDQRTTLHELAQRAVGEALVCSQDDATPGPHPCLEDQEPDSAC